MEMNEVIENAIKERIETIEVAMRETPAGKNALDCFNKLEDLLESIDQKQEWEKVWQACLDWEYCFCRQAYIQGVRDHDAIVKHEIFLNTNKKENN